MLDFLRHFNNWKCFRLGLLVSRVIYFLSDFKAVALSKSISSLVALQDFLTFLENIGNFLVPLLRMITMLMRDFTRRGE